MALNRNNLHLGQYNHGHGAHTQAMARGITRVTTSTFLATSFLTITPPIWKNQSVSLSVPWTQFLCKCSLAHHHRQHPIDMSKYKEAFSMQMAMAGLKPHHRIGLFLSLFFSVLFMKKKIQEQREKQKVENFIQFSLTRRIENKLTHLSELCLIQLSLWFVINLQFYFFSLIFNFWGWWCMYQGFVLFNL